MNDLIEIGKIGNPHGLKGEMRFFAVCNDAADISGIQRLFDYEGNTYFVDCIKSTGKNILLRLKDIDDISKAEKLKNKVLLVKRSELPELEKGKYYLDDLLGFDGYFDDGKFIGKLTDFLEPAGRLVYNFSGVLVPNVPEFIKEILIDEKKIIVKYVEGLV